MPQSDVLRDKHRPAYHEHHLLRTQRRVVVDLHLFQLDWYVDLHTTDSCNHSPCSLARGAAPDVPKPSAKELNEIVGKALDRGLDIIREMVKEGKL